jgi:uncharacterized membrane protein
MSSIERAIDINAPASTAYNVWTQFELFPTFLSDVEVVSQVDDTHLHWRANLLGDVEEWDTEITEQIPDKRIAWTSTNGPANAGVVTFHRLDDDHSRVMLQMSYDPDSATKKVADALGVLTRRIDHDLEQYKEFVEKHGNNIEGWRGKVRAKPDSAQ